MKKDFFLSVATCFKNTPDIIESYIKDTISVLEKNFKNFELVLIDNGSTDETPFKVKELLCKYKNIRMIVLSKEYNEQVVYTAALENTIGDFVILMDINTDPPELIPQMIEKAFAGGNDIVIAKMEDTGRRSLLYRLLAFLFYKTSYLLAGYKIETDWSNFVCFSRRIVNCILQVKDKNRYLKYLSIEYGFSKDFIGYKTIRRSKQSRSVNLIKKIDASISLFVANTNKPIKIAAFMGYLACLLNVLYIFYVILVNIFKLDVAEGWTSSSLILASMFAILFFIMSIICNYVACIMDEVKTGPLFYIAEEHNSCVIFENVNKKNVV